MVSYYNTALSMFPHHGGNPALRHHGSAAGNATTSPAGSPTGGSVSMSAGYAGNPSAVPGYPSYLMAAAGHHPPTTSGLMDAVTASRSTSVAGGAHNLISGDINSNQLLHHHQSSSSSPTSSHYLHSGHAAMAGLVPSGLYPSSVTTPPPPVPAGSNNPTFLDFPGNVGCGGPLTPPWTTGAGSWAGFGRPSNSYDSAWLQHQHQQIGSNSIHANNNNNDNSRLAGGTPVNLHPPSATVTSASPTSGGAPSDVPAVKDGGVPNQMSPQMMDQHFGRDMSASGQMPHMQHGNGLASKETKTNGGNFCNNVTSSSAENGSSSPTTESSGDNTRFNNSDMSSTGLAQYTSSNNNNNTSGLEGGQALSSDQMSPSAPRYKVEPVASTTDPEGPPSADAAAQMLSLSPPINYGIPPLVPAGANPSAAPHHFQPFGGHLSQSSLLQHHIPSSQAQQAHHIQSYSHHQQQHNQHLLAQQHAQLGMQQPHHPSAVLGHGGEPPMAAANGSEARDEDDDEDDLEEEEEEEGMQSPGNMASGRPGPARSPYEWMKKPAYQSPNSSTHDPNARTRTKDKYRVVYSDHQRLELEKEFHYSRYITIRRKAELANGIGLSERQVKIWFQNRRAKERRIVKKHEDMPGPSKDKLDGAMGGASAINAFSVATGHHLQHHHPHNVVHAAHHHHQLAAAAAMDPFGGAGAGGSGMMAQHFSQFAPLMKFE